MASRDGPVSSRASTDEPGTAPRTAAQAAGDAAERAVAEDLARRGWKMLGRNVHAGRSELDLVAIDPGPPSRLVVIEVRWRRSRSFGLPEESIDRAKRASLRRGLGRLLEAGALPDGTVLPVLPVAIDLVVVEPGHTRGAARTIRHHRNALGD